MKCSRCGKANSQHEAICSTCQSAAERIPDKTPPNSEERQSGNLSDLTTMNPGLEALWKAAYGDAYPTPTVQGLSPLENEAQQIGASEKEALNKLWDSAQAAITSTQVNRTLESGQRIDAAALHKTLLTIEREIQSLSTTQLKNSNKAIKAIRRERVTAGLIDICYIALLALVTAFSLFWFIAPELRAVLAHPTRVSAAELVSFISLALSIFVLFSYLYPIVAKCQTIGQKTLGLSLSDSGGGTPPLASLILRGLLLPMSAITWPFAPPFWRELGFHNQLTHTMVLKIPGYSRLP